MTMAYVYLGLAIIAEVVATTALKASDEFSRPWPTMIVILGYALTFYLMTLVFRSMPVGIVYAIWAGLGVVLVAIVAAVVYREIPDWPAILGMGMIISGVVIINVFSKTVGH